MTKNEKAALIQSYLHSIYFNSVSFNSIYLVIEANYSVISIKIFVFASKYSVILHLHDTCKTTYYFLVQVEQVFSRGQVVYFSGEWRWKL